MERIAVGLLLIALGTAARCDTPALEAEVLEASQAVMLPGTSQDRIRYLILHHKHQADRERLSAWLHRHGGAEVVFETTDGTTHAAVLQRLKHCFGRGLLLYADAVELKEKAVIRLRLEGD
jgi:hypothetical protein